jgi:hypothetical protein
MVLEVLGEMMRQTATLALLLVIPAPVFAAHPIEIQPAHGTPIEWRERAVLESLLGKRQ